MRGSAGGARLRSSAVLAALVVAATVVPVALTSLASQAAASTVGTATEATGFQEDAAHDGLAAQALTLPLASSWTTPDLGGYVSYPVVAGGRVFVISSSGADPALLWCFDIVTGTRLWGPVDVSEAGQAGLAYDSGRLFVENSDAVVRSIDPATGAEQWVTQISDPFNQEHADNTDISAGGGTVYAGEGAYGGLVGIDETTGTVLWRNQTGTGWSGAAAVAGGGVFTVTGQRLDATTGTAVWSAAAGGLPAVAGGRVFLRSNDTNGDAVGHIVDATAGTELRQFVSATAPAIDTSHVFALQLPATAGAPQPLVATDPATGATLWSFTGDGQLASSPVATSTAVFVGSATGMVYGVAPTTGQVVWSANVGAPVTANPYAPPADVIDGCGCVGMAVAADRLFVPAGNRLHVYAAADAGGTATTPPAADPLVVPASGTGGASLALQVDAAHDGVVAADDTGGQLHPQWSVHLDGAVSYPLVVNGTVYAVADTTDHASVYAFDAVSGARRWGPLTFYFHGDLGPASQLAYDNGKIFVTDTASDLFAIDAATGTRLWRRLETSTRSEVAPVATAGWVYSSPVAAYDETTGADVWHGQMWNWEGEFGSLAVGSGGVFDTGPAETSDGYNGVSGSRMWSTPSGISGPGGTTPTVAGGLVVTRGEDFSHSTARLLDPATGQLRATLETVVPAAATRSSAWVVQRGALAAYDLTTRRPVWRVSVPAIASAPVVAAGNVFVATSDAHLLTFDAASGAAIGDVPIDGDFPWWTENRAPTPALAIGHGIVALPLGDELQVLADSRYTATGAVATPAPAAAPTDVHAQPLPNGDVAVSWTAAPGAQSYVVDLYETGPTYQLPHQAEVITSATTVTVTGLHPGLNYGVGVQAHDVDGSESLQAAGGVVNTSTVPPPPLNVDSGAYPDHIDIDWTAPPDVPGSPTTGYDVYRHDESTASWTRVTTGLSTTSFTDVSVVSGHTYTYYVTAINGIGESDPSMETIAGPHEPPTMAVSSSPAPHSSSPSASFVFHGTATSSAFEPLDYRCRLDTEALHECPADPTWSGLADGVHTAVLEVRDTEGGRARTTYTWTIDTVRPRASLLAPTDIVRTATPIPVRWTGADDRSGVASYDVRYRSAAWNSGFGQYVRPSGWQATTLTSTTLRPRPGRQYCFSVRSRDRAGNVSGWTPERCVAVPVDDRALTVTAGTWRRATAAGDYQGTDTRTKARGSELTLQGVRGDRIALVATVCAGCGRVAVWVNGTRIATVDLSSSTTRHRRVFLLPAFPLGLVTVTIRSIEARLVEIDGLAVSRR